MGNLKKEQKKLLAKELTRVTMEYMMGLNEENKSRIYTIVQKSSWKLARLYHRAIKKQHKDVLAVKDKKKTNHPETTVVYTGAAKAS